MDVARLNQVLGKAPRPQKTATLVVCVNPAAGRHLERKLCSAKLRYEFFDAARLRGFAVTGDRSRVFRFALRHGDWLAANGRVVGQSYEPFDAATAEAVRGFLAAPLT